MSQAEDTSRRSKWERAPAKKVNIAELLQPGFFSEQEGIISPKPIFGRISVMGIIVSIHDKNSYKNVFLDDGTASVAVRLFGEVRCEVGNVLHVLGYARMFGQERYITPEIIKRLDDSRWLTVRKKEMGVLEKISPELVQQESVAENTAEITLELIRKEDQGDGIDIEFLLRKGVSENCLEMLFKEGAVFETKPGKIKALD